MLLRPNMCYEIAIMEAEGEYICKVAQGHVCDLCRGQMSRRNKNLEEVKLCFVFSLFQSTIFSNTYENMK